jgi:tRNA(Arg) A34 adenosine deaminase TadA
MTEKTKNHSIEMILNPEAKDNDMTRRHFLQRSAVVAAGAGVVPMLLSGPAVHAATNQPGCSEWTQPTDADFQAIVGKDKAEFLDRVLDVLENEVVPKTEKGVREGNKLFGAAILNKSDLSTVIATTNNETGNPLFHGEVQAIFEYYDLPKDKRPAPKDTIFIATHEPCPLCLSSITWGGYDNFFYLFTYEDSRDAYGIPHDIVMLDEIFRDPEGTYNEKNKFWSSWSIRDLIATTTPEQQAAFTKRVEALKAKYAELSDTYQKAKAAGKGADVPLK